MIVRLSMASLGFAARQSLRAQRLRSGQCMRCFHASLRQAAQDGTSAQDDAEIHEKAPYGAPERGPSRRERAASISNEVSMLQRGPPPPDAPTDGPGSVTGTSQGDPEPPTTSAGSTQTPGSLGGEHIGENVSAAREGADGRGVGRITGADESVRGKHPGASGMRAPSSDAVAGNRPGASDMRTPSSDADAGNRPPLCEKETAALRDKLGRAQGLPYQPRVPSETELLRGGTSAATPASGNHLGIVVDRYKVARSPAKPLVEEGERRARPLHNPQPLVQKLVAGKYPESWLSTDKARYKHKTLNEVMRLLALNATYLGKDAEKLMERARPLLPAAMQALRPAQTKEANAEAKAAA